MIVDDCPGSGWFLDKVIVRGGSDQEYLFECSRWLDEGEDDFQLERTLYVAHEASPPKQGIVSDIVFCYIWF